MGTQVYQRKQYKVYRAGNGYIVHNSNYPFFKKHTHVNSYYMAKKIIDSVVRRNIPKRFNCYLLKSLARVSDDKEYIDAIQEVISKKHTSD